MYCSKCGTNVSDGSAFCSACGQPTAAAGAIAPAVERPAPGIPAQYVPSPLTPILPSPYAGFWLRVVAHLIDDLLLGIGIGILVLIGVAMVGVDSIRSMVEGMKGEDFQMPGSLISAIFFVPLASIVMVWIYNASMESSQHQGTLGKVALGLIVTDSQGRPIGFGHATGGYFAKIITGLIPLGIGYAMAGFTEKKQALHDMIAGCLVLRRT
jgi:uncharacterized RDD family membrane protein YckC